tara:strand:+ start:213 stop:1358 length:1146 start_codon:yes stop_codon:yes gene_type:complete
MEVISLKSFLNLFHKKDEVKYTVNKMLTTMTVKVGNKIHLLSKYADTKKITRESLQLLCDHINNRDDYLTRFYNLSLSIDFSNLVISATDVMPMKNNKMNNNQEIRFKNIIRNLHMIDILHKTKSGIDNVPTFFDVLFNLYFNGIIDYKLLTPSALHYIQKGRIGSVFSSYFFRASIMNPYLVYSLNQTIFKATRIFSPTLGWSSYCYGFMESPYVTEYVGTDVIPSVCEKTSKFSNIYTKKKIDIYCTPSEQLLVNRKFMQKYKNHFDLVFFSPPYYELELYKSKNQSTDQYKTYNEWLDQYWNKTMKLCNHVLEKGGKMCYILSGYGSSNTKHFDLLNDMNNIAKTYFKLLSTQPMFNKNVHVTTHRDTGEQIVIFCKK